MHSSTVPARVCHARSRSPALVDPIRTTLPMGGAGQSLDLQFHQALGNKAQSSPVTDRPPSSFPKGYEGSSRRSSVVSPNQVVCRNPTLPTDHRWPTASRSLATALWVGVRALAACSAALHHRSGHDHGQPTMGLGLRVSLDVPQSSEPSRLSIFQTDGQRRVRARTITKRPPIKAR